MRQQRIFSYSCIQGKDHRPCNVFLTGGNQINTVYLNYGLSGLHRRVTLDMHGKVDKIGVNEH